MPLLFFFFFNDTATTEIYTLSLHDALPILARAQGIGDAQFVAGVRPQCIVCGELLSHLPCQRRVQAAVADRKSTRLNSSHSQISYAVFCLKKKKSKLKEDKLYYAPTSDVTA